MVFDKCSMFKTGERIYQQNTVSSSAYYVRQGYLKIYRTGIRGQQQIIRVAKKGEIVGYHSLLTQEPESTTCECMVNSVLCEIDGESLEDYIRTDKHLSNALLKLSCAEIKMTSESILVMTQKTVRGRMAQLLLNLFKLFNLNIGEYFPVRITRDDLANWVGTSKESVSRCLNEFHKDNLIRLETRNFIVTNTVRLKKVALIS